MENRDSVTKDNKYFTLLYLSAYTIRCHRKLKFAVQKRSRGLVEGHTISVQDVSHTIYPLLPQSSSCSVVWESTIIGSEGWLTRQHPHKVTIPFDLLLGNIIHEGTCSDHCSDFLIPYFVTSSLVCCSSKTPHFTSCDLSLKISI